jgi:hypothetical protein
MSSNPSYHYTPEREKWLRLEAREQEERKRDHALGCSRCGSELDSESCDALKAALLKDNWHRDEQTVEHNGNGMHEEEAGG